MEWIILIVIVGGLVYWVMSTFTTPSSPGQPHRHRNRCRCGR